MQLQASRLDPGGSWAARRAKAESHPRTTRSQASKGFCLSLGREARGAAEHRGDAAGVHSARANAGKLNTQGHAGRGGHRARDDGGDVRSTRAVGAQMQVGRDARKIVYPGTHAESTAAFILNNTMLSCRGRRRGRCAPRRFHSQLVPRVIPRAAAEYLRYPHHALDAQCSSSKTLVIRQGSEKVRGNWPTCLNS